MLRSSSPARALLAAAIVGLAGALPAQVVYTITAAADPVAEGNAGTRTLTARYTITPPVAAADGTVRIAWQTRDGAARSGLDYLRATGTLTFQAGGPDTLEVAVTVLGDSVREPNEDLFLLATVQAPAGRVTVEPALLPLVIENDDPLPDGWCLGAGEGRVVEFNPLAPTTTTIERPAPWGAVLGGAMVDRTTFALLEGTDEGPLLQRANTLTLRAEPVGVVEALAGEARPIGLAMDRHRGLLWAGREDARGAVALMVLDPATGIAEPAQATAPAGPWAGWAFHPLTGALHVLADGSLWRLAEPGAPAVVVGTLAQPTAGAAAFAAGNGRLYAAAATSNAGLLLVNHHGASIVPPGPPGTAGSVVLVAGALGAFDFMPPATLPRGYVSFAGDGSGTEQPGATGTAALAIVLDPPAASPVEVTLDATDATARRGVGYELPSPATVSLTGGGAAAVYTILHDGFPSPAQSFVARLAVNTPGHVAGIDVATVERLDADRRVAWDAASDGGWRVVAIDPAAAGVRFTTAPQPAGTGWSDDVLVYTGPDTTAGPDFAVELPPVNLFGAGWVRLEWHQALEADGPAGTPIPLLEWSDDDGVTWEPLLMPALGDGTPLGTRAAPADMGVDLTAVGAGRESLRLRMRLRDLHVRHFWIDGLRLLRESLPPGRSLVAAPRLVVPAAGPGVFTVEARIAPPAPGAGEVVYTLVGGTAVADVDHGAASGTVAHAAGAGSVSLSVETLSTEARRGDRTLLLGLAPTNPAIASLAPVELILRDDTPLPGAIARLGGARGFMGRLATQQPDILRDRLAPNPLARTGDWDHQAGASAQLHLIEDAPTLRLHTIAAGSGRVVASHVVTLTDTRRPVAGFCWDKAGARWALLMADETAAEVVYLSTQDGSEVARVVLAAAAPWRGLAIGDDGAHYGILAGNPGTIARLDTSTGTSTVAATPPFVVGRAAPTHLASGSPWLYVAVPLTEDDLGASPAQWARWHVATGEMQSLGVLGNSLVDFTALAIEDDPTRGPGAGLFLY